MHRSALESTSAQVKSHFAGSFKGWHVYFIFLTLIVIASAGVRAGAWHHWRTGCH